MADRDRDAQGRPRNARPRDGLGRPLPRGARGVPSVPDGLVLSSAETLRMAQSLIDRGRPFHAHEVLEARWRTCPAAERDLWKGLAQLAVGITHQLRGNTSGAITLIGRGAHHLRPCTDRGDDAVAPVGDRSDGVHGVDVTGIRAWAEDAVTRLRAGQSPSEPPRLQAQEESS